MPRHERLDFKNAIHYVRVRGADGSQIFFDASSLRSFPYAARQHAPQNSYGDVGSDRHCLRRPSGQNEHNPLPPDVGSIPGSRIDIMVSRHYGVQGWNLAACAQVPSLKTLLMRFGTAADSGN